MLAVTALVVTAKVVELLPAGMVMVAGTWAQGWVEFKEITVPPSGATALRVTVPTALVPPVTVPGEMDTMWTETEAPTTNPELTVLLPRVADSVSD